MRFIYLKEKTFFQVGMLLKKKVIEKYLFFTAVEVYHSCQSIHYLRFWCPEPVFEMKNLGSFPGALASGDDS